MARLGGDEFFVLLEEVQDELAVESVIRKLLAEAVRPYDLPGGDQARLSASMGVSLFPDNANDAAALVKLADTAMYSAKQAGKNGYCFYSAGNGAVLRVEPGRPSFEPGPANGTARAAVRPLGSSAPRSASPSPEGESPPPH